MRRDKADTVTHYYGTLELLSKISIPDYVQKCPIDCNCDMQSTVDSVYFSIIIN